MVLNSGRGRNRASARQEPGSKLDAVHPLGKRRRRGLGVKQDMFEGPLTGNIPEILNNGQVTEGSFVTAGQLALALTPYAQVTELATNTAADEPGRQGHRRAGAQAGQQRPRAGPGPIRNHSGPGHHRRSSSGPRQHPGGPAVQPHHRAGRQVRPDRLRRARGRGGHQKHAGQRGPQARELQHHCCDERRHRLRQQRHPGQRGQHLRPEDGGGPARP